jgi:hypothetical protein
MLVTELSPRGLDTTAQEKAARQDINHSDLIFENPNHSKNAWRPFHEEEEESESESGSEEEQNMPEESHGDVHLSQRLAAVHV